MKAIKSVSVKKLKSTKAINREFWVTYLGEVDIEDEWLLGIGDLNNVLEGIFPCS